MGKKAKSDIILPKDKIAQFQSAIDGILSPSTDTVKLYDTSYLDTFKEHEEAHIILYGLLATKKKRECYFATLFNAVFTQKVDSFMFSRRIFENLLQNDTNHEYVKIHNDHYMPFLDDCINSSKVLTVVEPPVGMKAGFYRINKENKIHGVLCKIISKEWLDISFEKRYKWFRENQNKNEDLKPLTEEERNEIREKAKARRGEK